MSGKRGLLLRAARGGDPGREGLASDQALCQDLTVLSHRPARRCAAVQESRRCGCALNCVSVAESPFRTVTRENKRLRSKDSRSYPLSWHC